MRNRPFQVFLWVLLSTLLTAVDGSAQDRDALLESAYEYLAEQEFELARQQFDLLAGYNSRDPEALLGLGICAFHDNDLDEAEYRLGRALDYEYKDARMWYWLGRVAFKRRSYADAWYNLNDAWKLDSMVAEIDLYRGASAYEVGLDSIARISLDKFSRDFPNHAYGHYYRGMSLLQIRAEDQALLAFERALELDDRIPRFHLGKGDAYAGKGEYILASIAYRAATRRNPDYGEAWYRLGWALQQTGQPRSALEAAEKAAALLPNDGDVLLLQASTLHDSGQHKQAKNILVNNQELIGQPNNANFLLGRIYAALGDDDSAWLLFNSVEKIDPNRDDVQLAWATSCFRMERFEEAADLYSKCLSRNPGDALYMYNLGIVRAFQGEDSSACLLFEDVIKLEDAEFRPLAEKALKDYCGR